MKCHLVRLNFLISNVFFFECFLGVAWRLFRIQMTDRKSYTREFKSSVTQLTLDNGKNVSSASRKFSVDRRRIRVWLKHEENLENQKRERRSNGRGCTSRFLVMQQALYDYYKKKQHEGKTIGGLIVEQSSLLKNFIQMKILKLLVNGFRDLLTVSKFHFVEKHIVHKKIHKV